MRTRFRCTLVHGAGSRSYCGFWRDRCSRRRFAAAGHLRFGRRGSRWTSGLWRSSSRSHGLRRSSRLLGLRGWCGLRRRRSRRTLTRYGCRRLTCGRCNRSGSGLRCSAWRGGGRRDRRANWRNRPCDEGLRRLIAEALLQRPRRRLRRRCRRVAWDRRGDGGPPLHDGRLAQRGAILRHRSAAGRALGFRGLGQLRSIQRAGPFVGLVRVA